MWIMNNWYLIVAAISIVVFATSTIYIFIRAPKGIQETNLKEWLKYAVTEAEIELGSGTGQLKLRKVYVKATAQFPWILKYISFETFSEWVDEALAWLKEQLAKNANIAKIVKEE